MARKRGRSAVHLDLDTPSNRARLADPEHYLSTLEDALVILDEIHRVPGLFQVLRGLIDRDPARCARRSDTGDGAALNPDEARYLTARGS